MTDPDERPAAEVPDSGEDSGGAAGSVAPKEASADGASKAVKAFWAPKGPPTTVAAVTLPRAVQAASVAIVVQVGLSLLSAALWWGYTSEQGQQWVAANNRLANSNKDKKSPYTAAEIAHDLHSFRLNVTIDSVVIAVLFLLAVRNIRRGRGGARWLYVAASVFFSVGRIGGLQASGPKVPNVVGFLVAVAAIVAVVLLFFPESAKFFGAVKAQRLAAIQATRGEGAAPPRPAGLRGRFAPPPPREPRSGATSARKPGPARKPAPVRKPATVRPATPAGSSRRKSKGRGAALDPTVPIAADAAEPTASNRGRGKSRRG